MTDTISTLIQLLEAWGEGEECKRRIYDCCMNLGFPYIADDHFTEGGKCVSAVGCAVYDIACKREFDISRVQEHLSDHEAALAHHYSICGKRT